MKVGTFLDPEFRKGVKGSQPNTPLILPLERTARPLGGALLGLIRTGCSLISHIHSAWQIFPRDPSGRD